MGFGPYMPPVSHSYYPYLGPRRTKVSYARTRAPKYSSKPRIKYLQKLRGRYNRRRKGVYMRKTYIKKCRPISACTRKQVRQIVNYHINKNTQNKYVYSTIDITESHITNGALPGSANQVFDMSSLTRASGDTTTSIVIPEAQSSDAPDLNGHRKGNSINLTNLQLRMQFSSSDQQRKVKFWIYVIKARGLSTPDQSKLQPSDFFDNQSIWRTANQKEVCHSVLLKKSVYLAGKPLGDNSSGHALYTQKTKRRVYNLNLKNLQLKVDTSGYTQNYNLHLVVFPEWEDAEDVTSPTSKPSWKASTYLFYRDG